MSKTSDSSRLGHTTLEERDLTEEELNAVAGGSYLYHPLLETMRYGAQGAAEGTTLVGAMFR
jgi:hypothetical protein